MRPLSLVGLAIWPILAFAQGVTKVDDRDASIQYSPPGAWQVGGQGDEYDGTTTYSLIAYAQFSFTFHGVAVQVIGTPDTPASGPVSGAFTYTLDGGPEQSGSAGGPRAPGTILISLQNLPNTDHTLVVKNGGPAATKFVLDAIQYTTQVDVTSTLTTAVTSAGPTGPVTVPVTLTVTIASATTDLPTPTPNPTSPPSSTPTPVALIAGVAVGGACGLGLLILLTLLLRRRCQQQQIYHDPHEPYMSSKTPDPGPVRLIPPVPPNGRRSEGWTPTPPPAGSHTATSSPPLPSSTPLSYDTSVLAYLDDPRRPVPPGGGGSPGGGGGGGVPAPPPGLAPGPQAPPYNPYAATSTPTPPTQWNR